MCICQAFVAPFSQLLYARLGTGISTDQLMEIVGGFLSPGDPMGNLYVCIYSSLLLGFYILYSMPYQFTMWSHGIIVQCITFSGGLKVCQYLKVPPREAFIAQIWGTVLGIKMSRSLLLLSLTNLTGVVIQYSMLLSFQLFSEKTYYYVLQL